MYGIIVSQPKKPSLIKILFMHYLSCDLTEWHVKLLNQTLE